MRPAKLAAAVIATSCLTAGGTAYADGDRATGGAWSRSKSSATHGGSVVSEHFRKTTMLVPRPAPQSSPQSAPHSRPRSGPRSRPESQAPRRPHAHRHFDNRPFIHHRPFLHHRQFIAPAPIIVPAPAYYGYAPPPYVPPPAVAVPPPVYIERGDGYWYYCSALGAYYPDVTQCPVPWQPVPAG